MDLKYSNACKEVLVLFDYFLDENDFAKIPKKQIEHLNKIANQEYDFVIDKTKELEEQKISKEAKAIIISLYKKYFVTPEQRKKVDKIIAIGNKQKNIKKTNNSSFNNFEEDLEYKNIIEDKEQIEDSKTIQNEEKALVKTESIWKKIINKISKCFHLKYQKDI